MAKGKADGTGLVYATYIGDVVSLTTIDSGTGIAVDDGGNTSFFAWAAEPNRAVKRVVPG